MKTLHFDVFIQASREKVWNSIVHEEPYRVWTAPFHEGSTFEGGWNTGDKIKFIAPEEDGSRSGMISEIAESRFPEFISIRHLGMLYNGVEDTSSEEVKKWAPSYENYTLTEENGFTHFQVALDSSEEYVEMFNEMWPKALEKLKEVAEKM
jgi:uncharacterized protein YndB with AHSA1/START domain